LLAYLPCGGCGGRPLLKSSNVLKKEVMPGKSQADLFQQVALQSAGKRREKQQLLLSRERPKGRPEKKAHLYSRVNITLTYPCHPVCVCFTNKYVYNHLNPQDMRFREAILGQSKGMSILVNESVFLFYAQPRVLIFGLPAVGLYRLLVVFKLSLAEDELVVTKPEGVL